MVWTCERNINKTLGDCEGDGSVLYGVVYDFGALSVLYAGLFVSAKSSNKMQAGTVHDWQINQKKS